MKKLFLVLMVFIGSVLYSQETEKRDYVDGFLEVGGSPFGSEWDSDGYAPDNLRKTWIFYSALNIEIKPFPWMFFGGQVKTYFFDQKKERSFMPTNIDFSVWTGFRYRFVEIGFRHYCSHPVNAYIQKDPIMGFNRMYEEIYLRFNF